MALPMAPAAVLPHWFPLRWQLDQGLRGTSPLPWCSGGWYAGALRDQLLALRRGAEGSWSNGAELPIQPLLAAMAARSLAYPAEPLLLVPVPSAQRHANPVPLRLAQHLALQLQEVQGVQSCQLRPELLQRRCRLAAQHRLGRQQRWRNQWLSFRALLAPEHKTGSVVLVDDVLTSGATALAARNALQSAGWSVAGLLCLARTPRKHAGQSTGLGAGVI